MLHRLIRLAVAAVLLAGPELCRATDAAAGAELAAGDAAYARRADERDAAGKIARTNIDAAILHYEAAVRAAPENHEVRFKLMEALYFLGHFVTPDAAEQKRTFARSIELTNDVMRLLAERVGEKNLAELDPARQAELLTEVPEAARAHFWAAINWGLWGMAYGNFASAREGVAGRIRDHAAIVTCLDERFADAGGLRLQGRLFTVVPRIPFATWWADRQEGIAMLRRAHAISNHDPRNALFLAEALLEYQPEARAEAMTLLREAAAHVPDPRQLIEETETVEAARARLADEKAKES
jgi:hypothetical protein